MSDSTTSAAPLQIRGLAKRYGDVPAVDGIDLDVDVNELVALVGPSGCGKSTVLRTIAGLTPADAGTVCLGGEMVEDGKVRLPPERRSVGLVFQEHALFPHLTVRDNVGFGVRDLSRTGVTARVDEMLQLVDLAEHGRRFPHELSGGERQRVALARALAPAPALMLFDEPFASLDHNLRVQLRKEVTTALRATGTPAVFVTHDQQEALAIGNRIAVMRDGHIIQIDSPENVYHRPTNRFVGAFMGDASFLAVVSTGDTMATALGAVDPSEARAIDSNAELQVMVRPDDLTWTPEPTGEALVESTEYHGSHHTAVVHLPGGETVQVACASREHPQPGQHGTVALAEGRRQTLVNARS